MCRSTARFSGPCPVRTRLSLGRRAYLKGFKVELRTGDGFIAARKKQELPALPKRAAEQSEE